MEMLARSQINSSGGANRDVEGGGNRKKINIMTNFVLFLQIYYNVLNLRLKNIIILNSINKIIV